MHITCPECGHSKDVGAINIPHGVVMAKCSECSAEFNIGEPAPFLGEVLPLSACPACNTPLNEQPVSGSCPRCSLVFEKYQQRQSQNAPRLQSETTPVLQRLTRYYRHVGIVLAALLCLVVWFSHDWKLDRDYALQPGVWQGEMTFRGKKHPFILNLETVQKGTLSGRMEWVGQMPSYILAIRGTYNGNHLLFEDYAFISNSGDYGLHDKKDVYITDEEMNGTDKNGGAILHAVRRASTPDVMQELKKM